MSAKLLILASFISLANAQPILQPPVWAKNAIWYQIFPERFRNGDAANDPKPKDLEGAWPYRLSEGWEIIPWNSDWYQLQPWELRTGKNFYDNFAQRRYGGDMQGILDKIGYLEELGITAIYLNPIFESPSLHKYDATYYHHIDNNFGPDPEKDRMLWEQENPADPSTWKWTTADQLFLKLISEAHNRSIKVIIDGVFNHTGITFWAFQHIKKYGKNSPYVFWYTIKRFDDTATTANEFDYEGWYGVKDLPELREDENGIVEGSREHIKAAVMRWMDPNGDGDPSDGIDGWRLDVASQVETAFWKEFRQWTREINPESYLVGEVWWEDWANNKMYDPTPWIADGSVFDAVMNYRAMIPIYDFLTNKKNAISSTMFASRIVELMQQFKKDITQVQLNTLDSHDTDRLPSIIVNPDRWFDHVASTKDNAVYDVRKPNTDEIQIQKMAVALQFGLIGAPSIYYGSEAGMWGGDDPDERKPMVWRDMQYESEKSHPFGKERSIDSVYFDEDLFDFYRSIVALRKSHPLLVEGDIRSLSTNDKTNTVILRRQLGNESIVICVNNSTKKQRVSFPSPWNGKKPISNLLTNKRISYKKQLTLMLEPKTVVFIGE
jgi:glycosidase